MAAVQWRHFENINPVDQDRINPGPTQRLLANSEKVSVGKSWTQCKRGGNTSENIHWINLNSIYISQCFVCSIYICQILIKICIEVFIVTAMEQKREQKGADPVRWCQISHFCQYCCILLTYSGTIAFGP